MDATIRDSGFLSRTILYITWTHHPTWKRPYSFDLSRLKHEYHNQTGGNFGLAPEQTKSPDGATEN